MKLAIRLWTRQTCQTVRSGSRPHTGRVCPGPGSLDHESTFTSHDLTGVLGSEGRLMSGRSRLEHATFGKSISRVLSIRRQSQPRKNSGSPQLRRPGAVGGSAVLPFPASSPLFSCIQSRLAPTMYQIPRLDPGASGRGQLTALNSHQSRPQSCLRSTHS